MDGKQKLATSMWFRRCGVLGELDLDDPSSPLCSSGPYEVCFTPSALVKLDFQRAGVERLDGVGEGLVWREGVYAKRSLWVVDDDGRDVLLAGVDQRNLNHAGTASGQDKNNQQRDGESKGFHFFLHFFSMTRAASTAPLRLSCSFKGKTRMFQFQRLVFLVGR